MLCVPIASYENVIFRLIRSKRAMPEMAYYPMSPVRSTSIDAQAKVQYS